MIIMEAKTKRCSKCKQWLALSNFNKRATGKDSLRSWCRQCHQQEYYQNHHQEYCQTVNGRLHYCFNDMQQRCNNSKHTDYANYGGRGIKNLMMWPEFFYYITVTLGYDTHNKLKNLTIDRIDVNGDYEIKNLRIATRSQQCMNMRKRQTWGGQACSSRFKGVIWSKRSKKWQVQLTKDGKPHFLGYFNDEIRAARAYDTKAEELFGEFACTNAMLGLYD